MQSTSSYLQLIISKHTCNLFDVWNGGKDTRTNKYRTKKQQDIKVYIFLSQQHIFWGKSDEGVLHKYENLPSLQQHK
jgi:hypothetical protein